MWIDTTAPDEHAYFTKQESWMEHFGSLASLDRISSEMYSWNPHVDVAVAISDHILDLYVSFIAFLRAPLPHIEKCSFSNG